MCLLVKGSSYRPWETKVKHLLLLDKHFYLYNSSIQLQEVTLSI